MRQSPGEPSAETLKQFAPCAGIGEVAAVAIAAFGFEIERRGENDEALRPGEAFECDSGSPPHRAAPAVNANQVNAAVLRDNAGRPAHLHSDGIRALRHVDRFMIEQEHAGMRGARFGREIGRKITASMP